MLLFGKNAKILEKNTESLEKIANVVTQFSKEGNNDTDSMISDNEKERVAYALNLCTISLSKIVEYDDLYILEQEYDAILNNINLEVFPKDESLLIILKQLLDTITFFRIQAGDKAMLDKEYQHKLKNAIWAATPSLNVLLSGDPISIALSLISQVGTGYMNYRREKANILLNKENAEWNLQRSAIEQFNALRSELFTTAWRLSDKYAFPDEYRITEKQIEQYNLILLDDNDLRRYERLKYIESKFTAYPPFYYYIGHASYKIWINEKNPENMRQEHKKNAEDSFYKLLSHNSSGILRENLITATCALELFDLLISENDGNESDKEKLIKLLRLATACAPNFKDVLQIVAMSYLRIGEQSEAKKLLRMLINESYNIKVNTQVLSGLYVYGYINNKDATQREKIRMNYETLKLGNNDSEVFLCPFPQNDGQDFESLEGDLLLQGKRKIFLEYCEIAQTLHERYTIEYNRVLQPKRHEQIVADYPLLDDSYDIEQRKNILDNLFKSEMAYEDYKSEIRYAAGQLLNVVNDWHAVTKKSPFLDAQLIEKSYVKILDALHKNNGLFSYLLDVKYEFDNTGTKKSIEITNIMKLIEQLTFKNLTKNAFEYTFQTGLIAHVNSFESMQDISNAEVELFKYCMNNNIDLTNTASIDKDTYNESDAENTISLSLFGDGAKKITEEIETNEKMLEKVKEYKDKLILTPHKEMEIYIKFGEGFNSYLERHKKALDYMWRDILMIINDKSISDTDFYLTTKGFVVCKGLWGIKKNLLANIKYSDIKVNDKGELEVNSKKYTNKHINMYKLHELIQGLSELNKDETGILQRDDNELYYEMKNCIDSIQHCAYKKTLC